MKCFQVPFASPPVDWTCPKGFNWGDKPTLVSSPVRFSKPKRLSKLPLTYIAIRLETCNRCDHIDCPIKNMTSCQRNARLKRPLMACPAGKWNPVKPDAGYNQEFS